MDSAARTRALVSLGFGGSGLLHFARPRVYERIMPPYLPRHRELVLISGAAEIAGAVGIQLPALRRLSAWGLLALLVAVFPANVQMAIDPAGTGSARIPRWALWARLPLQALFARGVMRAAAPGS